MKTEKQISRFLWKKEVLRKFSSVLASSANHDYIETNAPCYVRITFVFFLFLNCCFVNELVLTTWLQITETESIENIDRSGSHW